MDDKDTEKVNKSKEITEEDLDSVAGGRPWWWRSDRHILLRFFIGLTRILSEKIERKDKKKKHDKKEKKKLEQKIDENHLPHN